MIGNVTDLLRAEGLWNDTLVTFSSDNGGPVYSNGTSGGSNWPLRGGKAVRLLPVNSLWTRTLGTVYAAAGYCWC